MDDATVDQHIQRMDLAEEYAVCAAKARRAFRWACWAFLGMVLSGVVVVVALVMI